MSSVNLIVAMLGLEPHPEGGYYVETWRAAADRGERSTGSSIYYLLGAGERSAWHRVDAAEIWHYYAGDPLRLSIAAASGEEAAQVHELGPDLTAGQRPQLLVPPRQWQSAVSTGEWTLVGCTVSPAFELEGFELADRGWEPGPR